VDDPLQDVRDFWSWFSTIADALGEDFEDRALRDELDARVSALEEGLTWELGPGPHGEHVLAVSPDGERALLPAAERVVASAPPVPGWRFSIEGDDGGTIDVDATQWKYVLFRWKDGMFDVLVEARGLEERTEGDRHRVAAILLDGILGERRRLRTFADIEAVNVLPPDLVSKASNVGVLRDHLDRIAGEPE
jgi:hypothetical protein